MGDSSGNEASLIVLGGTKAGLRFVIEDSVDNIVIGSDPSCRFQIDLPGVSPVHARIWVDPQGVTIYETNSPRGLFINDDRVVAQATLRNGDVLWLGTPGDEDVVMIQCRFPTPKGEARRAPPPPIDEGAIQETVALGSLPPAQAPVESEPDVTPETEAGPARDVTPEPDDLEETQLVEAPTEPPAPATEVFMVDESLYASASKAPVPSVSEPAHFDVDFSRPAPALAAEDLEGTVADVTTVASPPANPEPTIIGSAVAPPTMYDAAAEAPTPPPRPVPAPRAPSYPPPGARSHETPRPSRAETPQPRRTAARAAPAAAPRPPAPVEDAAGVSASPALKYGLMAAGLLFVAAASFLVVRLLRPGAPGDTQATPPTSVVAAPPSTLAPPPVEPAPALEPEPEPAPPTTIPEEVVIVATDTPPPPPTAALPSVRPSAAAAPPRPAPRSATPPPTAATPAPVAAQQGQQVAGLLGQADAALAGRNFDAAAAAFDEVLKLDPQNARANQGKTAAQASAASLKRTFSPGRTTLGGKEAKADLGGFDTTGVKVAKASDYSGRIEFDAAPPRVVPGDSYTIRIYLVNDGKKAFKISSVTVATTTNGSREGGPIEVRAREVQVRDRVMLDERAYVWRAGTTSWTLEVVVATERDATFTNRLNWR